MTARPLLWLIVVLFVLPEIVATPCASDPPTGSGAPASATDANPASIVEAPKIDRHTRPVLIGRETTEHRSSLERAGIKNVSVGQPAPIDGLRISPIYEVRNCKRPQHVRHKEMHLG